MSVILRAARQAAKRTRARVAELTAPVTAAVEEGKRHAAAVLGRTRPGRVVLALAAFAWRRVPKWLRRGLAVCLAIPGPVDEIAAGLVAVVFIAGPLAVSRNARRELATAVAEAWSPR